MSMHLFNIFSKSKGNDHITAVLTRAVTNPRFFSEKRRFFKNSKPFMYPQTLSYIFGNIL